MITEAMIRAAYPNFIPYDPEKGQCSLLLYGVCISLQQRERKVRKKWENIDFLIICRIHQLNK